MRDTVRPRSDPPEIVQLIRAAADRRGVPRRVALAFAWVESRLNPDAEGDLDWHKRDGGELYVRHVLDSKRLEGNPCRNTPELWHSYGLFQLMACYHIAEAEHPKRLLNPTINADRGCEYIARLLKKTKGEVRAARLAYVGCGFDGRLCDERRVSKICDQLQVALNRYALEPELS